MISFKNKLLLYRRIVKRKEIFLVIATVLTVIFALILFFLNLYNYHFELKSTHYNNTYILLKNGRYFEFLCQNDVIDNKKDFSFKPFHEFQIENSSSTFKHIQTCKQNDSSLKKKTVYRRTAESLDIRHTITTIALENIGANAYYYTQIDYPLIADIIEKDNAIELYDLNCTTIILKKHGYDYVIVENSVRVGKEYEKEININIEMLIQCL